MRITDLLKSNAIELNVSLSSKDEAIEKLIALHEKAGSLKDSAKFKEDILKREEHSSFLHHRSRGNRLFCSRRQGIRSFIYDCGNRGRGRTSRDSVKTYDDAYGSRFFKRPSKCKGNVGILKDHRRHGSEKVP